MNQQDTPENRKKLANKEGDKLKAFITIPEKVQANVHEGFEPLLVSAEMIDKHFILVLNAILDFDDAA